jgi:hypothetical protein
VQMLARWAAKPRRAARAKEVRRRTAWSTIAQPAPEAGPICAINPELVIRTLNVTSPHIGGWLGAQRASRH